jgi:hypothetical protein
MADNEKEAVGETYLSYSSMEKINNCERRWWHYKVKKTPYDSDYQKSDALETGTLFHELLEHLEHSPKYLAVEKRLGVWEKLDELAKRNGVQDRDILCLVMAMTLRYLTVHQYSKLEFVAAEVKIEEEATYLGFADLILINPLTKVWWIADLKTAAKLSETKVARLFNDLQLNLYAYFKQQIADLCGLKVEKFAGCRYRVTTKNKVSRKEGEADGNFVARILDAMNREKTEHSLQSYDIEIPIKVMSPSAAFEKFMDSSITADVLRRGVRESKQNFSQCDSFFKPCEYWSQCHRCLASESAKLIKINTIDSYKTDDSFLD